MTEITPSAFTATLMPTEQPAVAEAVRAAFASGTPVYPLGGGTHLGCSAPPAEPGTALSLAGLQRLVNYPARDLTITVEAGMTIAAVARHLAAEGQRLPIDVPCPDKATVGGCVAAGAGGPRRYRWGTIRDYVIGLTAVDGCGIEFRAGGRVVKNAAGYGLCRLLTGSMGTLGVIVQATLMVKPLPEISALVACEVPDLEAAERLLAGLVATPTLPSAIEWVSGPAWKNDPALGPLSSSSAGRLLVGLEGTLAEVEWMIGKLQEDWRQGGISLAGDRNRSPGRTALAAAYGIPFTARRRVFAVTGGPGDPRLAQRRCQHDPDTSPAGSERVRSSARGQWDSAGPALSRFRPGGGFGA